MEKSMQKRINNAPFHGSSSHLIMTISKFYATEIGLPELKEINPTKFKFISDIRRELLRLELAGFIVFTKNDPNRWTITNKGVAYLYQLVKVHPRTISNNKDRI